MYKKMLIAATTTAVVLGGGTAALAVTGSSSPSAAPTGSTSRATSSTGKANSSSKAVPGQSGHKVLRRLVDGQFVTKGKKGFVTHDLIRGTVTVVSPTSITVVAADKKSQTYAVNAKTKVRMRTAGKGAASTIAAVKKGDKVYVTGTGTTALLAGRVLDIKK